jgi:hypothetical protein
MLLYLGDFLWPGTRALVEYSGSVLSFCFGKRVECMLQFLFQRRAIHMRRVSLGEERQFVLPRECPLLQRLHESGISGYGWVLCMGTPAAIGSPRGEATYV